MPMSHSKGVAASADRCSATGLTFGQDINFDKNVYSPRIHWLICYLLDSDISFE